jgi:hypothetical protein
MAGTFQATEPEFDRPNLSAGQKTPLAIEAKHCSGSSDYAGSANFAETRRHFCLLVFVHALTMNGSGGAA